MSLINRNPLRNWFLDFAGNFAGNFATRAMDWVETRVLLVVQNVGRQNFNTAPVHQHIGLWYKMFEMYPIGTLSGFFDDNAGRIFDFAAVYSNQGPQTQAEQAWRQYFRHLFTMICEGPMPWVVSLPDEKSEDVVKPARAQRRSDCLVSRDENILGPAEPSPAAR
ncbi:hypothetical protein CKM354_000731400 [Cercospora kikuchii]|uniref:Uncharacterized protein n=1 Tax=Cercospora kikuchii TaxID=84275 RepID=A0A9P3CP82_9PEZI|nr:uncharacterized protein CKM354_000731400 [Cercospora kikuchii]GIZ44105.1 hypothetical protein CKM354_000731400 [Cercospora kikuchii]